MDPSSSPAVRPQSSPAETLQFCHAPGTPPRIENGWEISREAGVETIQECARAVQRCLVSEIRAGDQPGSALTALLPEIRERCASMTRFVQILNSQDPGLGRDIEIGKAILPLAILAMSQLKLDTNPACLYDLYLRTHLDDQSGEPQISFPSWLLGTQNFLAIKPVMDKLPPAADYLQESPSLQGSLSSIQARLAEADQELSKFKELNDKSNAAAIAKGHAAPDTYANGIAKWAGNSESIKAEIPALFNQLSDVLPETLPAAMNMLAMKTSMKREIVAGYIQLAKDLEQVVEGALAAKMPDGVKVSLPQVAEDGTIMAERFVYSQPELQALKGNSEEVVKLLHTYVTVRAFLRAAIPAVSQISETKDLHPTILEALRQPFMKERGKQAIDWLIQSQDPAVREAALTVLADPVTTKDPKGGWGHQLVDTQNIRPVLWAARSYLTSETQDSENGYLQVMSASSELQEHLTPFLMKFKRAYAAKDYARVVKTISDEIASARMSKNFHRLLAPVAALSVVAADKDASRRLKNQIPNVTDLKDVIPGIVAVNESLANEVRALVDTGVRGVSVSMHDYYQDPKMEELWKFLSKFKLFLRHPSALDGLSGNEGMKSGILVAGKPGVGKSFFVKCLETELNVKSFTISPDQGERSAQKLMIDACRSIIEAAKKYASSSGACILFIDEAEAVMANRADPRVTNDQVELTCYLLQEINMIREKYPKILIIAATNYPDKIDEGMLRDGRFDIHVLMDLPPPPLREYIIKSTIASEKLKLDLDENQMKQLIDITDGMLPLPIKRTILETNRLARIEAQEAGRPFDISFELLLDLYKSEKELKRYRLADRMKEGNETSAAAAKSA